MTPLRKVLLFSLTLLLPVAAQARSHSNRRPVDFTRYVAIGDGFTAGYSNGSLIQTHQEQSFPAILARQAGAVDFRQPLVSAPGLPGELLLLNINPLDLDGGQQLGHLLDLTPARPFNNLGIPQATLKLILNGTLDNYGLFFGRVLRRFGGTAVDQAVSLNPTFVTVWAGVQDVLRGTAQGEPGQIISGVEEFRQNYRLLLDRITSAAPTAKIVVGNLPDFTTGALSLTLPRFVIDPATQRPILDADGKPTPLIGILDGYDIGPLPAGSRVTLGALRRVQQGEGIPEELRSRFAALPRVGTPLDDPEVLTPAELGEIRIRTSAFNQVIAEEAARRSIPVADMTTLFRRFDEGIDFGGVRVSSRLITGGLISYDGAYPTGLGYTLVANEFIRTINTAYGSSIQPASIAQFISGP